MVEPVSLDRAKLNMKVESDVEDELITDLIVSAREWVEKDTGQILMAREVTERFDRFDCAMELRAWPVQQLIAVRYIDRDGVERSADARLTRAERPLAIAPAYGTRWPLPQLIEVEIEVVVRAGYDGAVPAPLRQAMLLLIGHWFHNREAAVTGASASELPLAVDALCRSYRLRRC